MFKHDFYNKKLKVGGITAGILVNIFIFTSIATSFSANKFVWLPVTVLSFYGTLIEFTWGPNLIGPNSHNYFVQSIFLLDLDFIFCLIFVLCNMASSGPLPSQAMVKIYQTQKTPFSTCFVGSFAVVFMFLFPTFGISSFSEGYALNFFDLSLKEYILGYLILFVLMRVLAGILFVPLIIFFCMALRYGRLSASDTKL